MSRTKHCPKCDADISDTYEPDDRSVGISASWFCDACDLGVADDGDYGPMEGDVPIMTAKEFRGDRPLGTPISELSGQPGDHRNPDDPRHAGYERFKRIAKSWGYD
jgi:hypothetical protein